MKITKTEIYKFSIPMHPFTIATGTMDYAQNIFIRVHTDGGFYGVGECSAFPMIVGETQGTCFELAKDFAMLWKGKPVFPIEERIQDLHQFTAFNNTIKSAFDMALYDISAKHKKMPLYEFLGGKKKNMQTDLTIGIDSPVKMAERAIEFISRGVTMIKIKLGKTASADIERIEKIRRAVGQGIVLRIDANQGWDFETAVAVLQGCRQYNIQFCEQPMRTHHDDRLAELRELSPIKIMADESVFDHFDAERIIRSNGCDYVNIKLAKSGGILEAMKIDAVCAQNNIPCMIGGMLESRVALSAFAHFALAHDNIIFYDMDTCMLGHQVDPVTGGVQFNGYLVEVPDEPGIGADADQAFLKTCEMVAI